MCYLKRLARLIAALGCVAALSSAIAFASETDADVVNAEPSAFSDSWLNAGEVVLSSAYEVQWANTLSVAIDLTYAGGQAKCYSVINGLPGTTKIEAHYSLYRIDSTGRPVVVKTFPIVVSNSQFLSFVQYCSASAGNTYRLTVDAYVTRNGVTESMYSGITRAY